MTKPKATWALWIQDITTGKWNRNSTLSTSGGFVDVKRILEIYAAKKSLHPDYYRILPAGRKPKGAG